MDLDARRIRQGLGPVDLAFHPRGLARGELDQPLLDLVDLRGEVDHVHACPILLKLGLLLDTENAGIEQSPVRGLRGVIDAFVPAHTVGGVPGRFLCRSKVVQSVIDQRPQALQQLEFSLCPVCSTWA